MGFIGCRIRVFGDLAVVEVTPSDIRQLADQRDEAVKLLKSCGFTRICLDLEGYRTGSLNPPDAGQ